MKIPISRAALAAMTLDEYRTHYPEVASGEVLEAMYDDRLVAFDEQVAISVQLVDELADEEVIADMDEQCPLCGGPQQILGKLGQRVHLRCRNCGADTNSAS
jgi:tRNA(Ile2) C34 agmatinyltransferase TiaS